MEVQTSPLYEKAKQLKEDGSRYFKDKNHSLALSSYMSAIELFDTLLDDQKQIEAFNLLNKDRQTIRANISQVYLSQEKYQDCITLCNQLLLEDDESPGILDNKIRGKTRYRLCKAMSVINQDHDFISDLANLNLKTEPCDWNLLPSGWSSNKTKSEHLVFDRGIAKSSHENENLIVILHGFGDNPGSFTNLPRSWKFEKTAYLLVPGCDIIDSDFSSSNDSCSKPVFSWFDYFNPITYEWYNESSSESFQSCRKNIKEHIDKLIRDHLVKECGWKMDQIFLFGFSQGGTIALEYLFWLNEQNRQASLGGVVGISTQLLGATRNLIHTNQKHQSSNKKNRYCIQTPVLLIHGEKDTKMPPKCHSDTVLCLTKSMPTKFAQSNLTHKEFPNRDHEMLRGSNRDEMKLFYNFMANNLNGVGKKKERTSINELVKNEGFIPL